MPVGGGERPVRFPGVIAAKRTIVQAAGKRALAPAVGRKWSYRFGAATQPYARSFMWRAFSQNFIGSRETSAR